jgi:hypothetical protein
MDALCECFARIGFRSRGFGQMLRDLLLGMFARGDILPDPDWGMLSV